MWDNETVTVGLTRTVDDPTRFTRELLALRENNDQPLSFTEFQKLVARDKPSDAPTSADLEVNDPVLSLSDAELFAHYPNVRPMDLRRLRKGFLSKKWHEKATALRAYESKILNYLRPLLLGGKATYTAYTGYLSVFHHEQVAPFFRLWALPVAAHDLKAHSYIGAGSGHGKSELIKVLIHALLQKGQGIILLDPHGDIAEQVTRWPEFEKDPQRLCYFSPYLAGKNEQGQSLYCVPGINPLSALHGASELDSVVENFIATMAAIIGSEGDISNRMKIILRPCLYTLAQYPGTTLYDLLAFISESDPENAPWVNKARKTLTNRSQLDTLESFFDKHYITTKNAIRDRLRALLSSDALDKCLTSENTIDLEHLMNTGKVVIFNLSAGILGQETSAGFGRFLLCALQNAALRRQNVAARYRKSVFLFMDEADRFMSEAVVSIYKETRKYGLHLAIAQQITGYGMSEEMWRAIAGNSRVRFAGAAGGDKATERDLSYMVGMDADELRQLKPLHFYSKSGNHDPVRFQLSKDLLGARHSMSRDAWERVKAYQLATYYRTTGQRPTTQTPTRDAEPTPKTTGLHYDY